MAHVAVEFAVTSEAIPDPVARDLRVDASPVGIVGLTAFTVTLGAGYFLVMTFQAAGFVH